MATDGQKFPPQKQDTQPEKEHVMDPTPRAVNPNYKAAGKLKGKVALVSGGDSGIGRSVCYHFALEGATIAFTYVKGQEDKDKDKTIKMTKEAKKGDARDPIAIPADLGYEENCRKAVDEVVKAFGDIDILVNNAAEQYVNTLINDITEGQIERVFRTNIFSYFFLSKFALKHMKEGSCIICCGANGSNQFFIKSYCAQRKWAAPINAYKGNAQLLDCIATKGAIVAFTRGLALQLVEKGIRVNGVAPGPVWTPLIPASFSEEKVANFGKQVPMKRAGQPYEIAPPYVSLACNEGSSYITGQDRSFTPMEG